MSGGKLPVKGIESFKQPLLCLPDATEEDWHFGKVKRRYIQAKCFDGKKSKVDFEKM